MREEGGYWLPLVLLVCALVVSTGESRVYRRFRVSRTRPYQTHHVTTTTTANRGNTHHYKTENHHRLDPLTTRSRHNNHLFSSTNNHNHHRNNRRNLTRHHRTTSGNHNSADANHHRNRKHHHQHRNHLANYKHHRRHQQHNKHRSSNNERRHFFYPYNNKNNKSNMSHDIRSRGHSNGRNHHHRRRLSAQTTFPKQSVKRHLGGTRRYLQYQIPFLQPMGMHTSIRSAFSNGLTYHRGPQLWDVGRLRNHHERIMNHLSSRIRDHVMRMRSHSVPHVGTTHYRSHPDNHRSSRQGGHRDHSSHQSRRQVHCHNGQPQHHDARMEGSVQTPGTRFKIPRGELGGIPEDVEVFRWPNVAPLRPTTTTATTTTTITTTTTTSRPITIDDSIVRKEKNLTKSKTWRPHPNPPFHHAGFSRGLPSNPLPTTPTRPDSINHNPTLTALSTQSPSPSVTQEWKGYGTTESGGSHTSTPTTSVHEHLHPQGHSRPTPTTSLPCIKCPPDTRVQAPRGRNCVYAQTPTPLPCIPQLRPDVQTIVTEGPTPGTRLQEGHYFVSFTVVVMEGNHGATPIANCKVGYDVEVRKCPELPHRAGLEARCSAGRAWGSLCTWRCLGNLQLQGASSTTCSGHPHPRWTHESPYCVAPSTPAPLPPSVRSGCKAPPDVPGGHYTCTPPDGRSINIPIPKDDPTVPRRPRNTSPAHHLEGSMCELGCGRGRTIALSQRGRQRLTCTSGGHWDHRPPPCRFQVSPALQDGDCKDITLRSPHSPLSFLPLPNFRTSSGVAARVTCVLESRSEGVHTRTCTAEDPELETKTHCKYRITLLDVSPDPDAVLVPGLTGSTGTGGGDEAGRETGFDDEWESERKYHNSGNDDTYAYSSNEQDDDYGDYDDEDGGDEADYYYDGNDYDIETLPELLQRDEGQTSASGRRGSSPNSPGRKGSKRRVNTETPSSTTARHNTTSRSRRLKKSQKKSSYPSLSLFSPSSSSSSSTSSEHSITDNVTVGDKDPRATVLEAVNDTSQSAGQTNPLHRNSRQRDGGNIHQHYYLRGQRARLYNNLKKDTVETKENGQLTRKETWSKGVQDTASSTSRGKEPQSKRIPVEDIPATMEAVMKMEVALGNCTMGREVARRLGKALTNQERCRAILTCHNPRYTCKDGSTGGQGRVELVWAVGVLYENQERDTINPVHVTEVETAISAILESTRDILTSQSLTSSLVSLGASVDSDSFLVTQLDLVCRQPGLKLQPENKRCRAE